MKNRFCAAVFRWASGFAGGVMLYFTFGVTLRLFNTMPHEAAGGIAQNLFPGYFAFLLASLFVAFFSALPLCKVHRSNCIAALLIVVALACVLIIAWWLGPQMLQAMTPDKKPLFKKLHGISMSLNLLSMIATLASPFFIRQSAPSENSRA